MITAYDVDSTYITEDKYGFKVTLSADGMDALLRKYSNMPKGQIARFSVDYERNTLTVIYYSPKPAPTTGITIGHTPDAPIVQEAGEYPARP